ncbi:hypothetical protein PENTCL1PPCAC_4781, partial [Pristionchus entomophagus]
DEVSLRFLTAINNVLTPWVMIITFSNVSLLFWFKGKKAEKNTSPLVIVRRITYIRQMGLDNSRGHVVVITNDVMLYATLPLHARLLYVLLKPNSKKDLDSSFHTLMINSTIANLIFALDCCLILEPSAAGIFYDFYKAMGPYFAKIELIKTTVVLTIDSILHLVLAVNRLTAILFPFKHQRFWSGSRLFWFCIFVWAAGFVYSIPLLLPGSTDFVIDINLYGLRSVEFTFCGNYYWIYSMSSAFLAIGMELLSLLFYVAMLFKFNDFKRKRRSSSAADIKRLTSGVMRTILASFCISIGTAHLCRGKSPWSNIAFALAIYISHWTQGAPILDGNYFSAVLRFLTAINNVLTPWVMIITFSNVSLLL